MQISTAANATNRLAALAGTGREVLLRVPCPEDAVGVHDLVRACPPLDGNSLYCNLLQCTHWAGTSVLAERAGEIAGFVAGHRIPDRPDTVFVWQVAVAPAFRGMRLGGCMLDALLARPACSGVTHLEATLTADNRASRRLFDGFARRHGAALERRLLFDARRHFAGRYASELLLRIGPLAGAARHSHAERRSA